MLANHTYYKYKTPYKGPFVITQYFNYVTVNLQYGLTKIKYNICCIKPYKLDIKVKDYSSINKSDDSSI